MVSAHLLLSSTCFMLSFSHSPVFSFCSHDLFSCYLLARAPHGLCSSSAVIDLLHAVILAFSGLLF